MFNTVTPVVIRSQENEIIDETPKTMSTSSPVENLTTEETNINKYFEKDLRKSLLIIGAIFALEIFFYFATMNNYLTRYLNF